MSLLGKIKELVRPSGSPSTIIRNSVLRRQKLLDKVDVFLPYLSSLLITVGFIWMLALPTALLGRGHYVSENALQPAQVSNSIQIIACTLINCTPAQVNTYWTWGDVYVADKYSDEVEKWTLQGLSSAE